MCTSLCESPELSAYGAQIVMSLPLSLSLSLSGAERVRRLQIVTRPQDTTGNEHLRKFLEKSTEKVPRAHQEPVCVRYWSV
eukprot:2332498-Rhodomonas_salina.1